MDDIPISVQSRRARLSRYAAATSTPKKREKQSIFLGKEESERYVIPVRETPQIKEKAAQNAKPYLIAFHSNQGREPPILTR